MLQSRLRSQYKSFKAQHVNAPHISQDGRFIGIDNRQRCQYDLREIRSEVSDLPMIQVVGDSGTAFDVDKHAAIRSLLLSCPDNGVVEFGLTCKEYDTNWFVAEYLGTHKEVKSIANIVEQSVDALAAGWAGSGDATFYMVLFDRISPTRFGDDTWLSDGIMFKELGDRVLCLEGGAQTLYQCTCVLLKGIRVYAVTNLRTGTFSAARILLTWRDPEEYLRSINASESQRNVATWCSSTLRESAQDVTSLIIPVEVP